MAPGWTLRADKDIFRRCWKEIGNSCIQTILSITPRGRKVKGDKSKCVDPVVFSNKMAWVSIAITLGATQAGSSNEVQDLLAWPQLHPNPNKLASAETLVALD